MNDPNNETNIRRAGARYVLGVPTISGRLLVSELLQKPVVGVDRQLRIVRLDGSRFAGRRLGDTSLADTDCVIMGVTRDGTVRTEIDDELELRSGDEVFVVGSDAEIAQIR